MLLRVGVNCVVYRFSALNAMCYSEPESSDSKAAHTGQLSKELPKPIRYAYTKEMTPGEEDPEYRRLYDRAPPVVPSIESLLYTKPFSDSMLVSIHKQYVEQVDIMSGTTHRAPSQKPSVEVPVPT